MNRVSQEIQHWGLWHTEHISVCAPQTEGKRLINNRTWQSLARWGQVNQNLLGKDGVLTMG